MTRRFQSANFLWWIIIPLFTIYLFLMVHWPYAIPFNYLGPVGQWTYYLISNYRLLLFLILWAWIIAHTCEAYVARRICRQLNIDDESTYLWMIQTFILGYPSLSILKGYTRRSFW